VKILQIKDFGAGFERFHHPDKPSCPFYVAVEPEDCLRPFWSLFNRIVLITWMFDNASAGVELMVFQHNGY
jgi:hypothetical protein